MKKFLGILVLGLLWCNVSFAEIIFERCSGLEPNLSPRAKWTINLEKEIIKEVSGTNNAIKYWRINKNFGDTIITFELLEASDVTDDVAQTLMSFVDMKYVFDIKEETLSMNIELSDLGKANKEVIKWFNEEVSSGGISKYVSGNCIVKNLYTKTNTNKDVLTFNCKLEKWNNWWGTDDEPQEGQFPQQTITFTADLNSKVIRWGSLETTLNVSDNSIEFYRYMKDPEDKKEVEFRYVVDRTNMQFQMIATKNKKKEGVSAIGKCTMAVEKKF